MTFCCRLLPLLSCLLMASLLLVCGIPAEGPEAATENSLLLLLREQWRREALESLAQRNSESWATLRAIVRKLRRGEMTLQEALPAYAEVYAQLYFVRDRRAQGRPTREEIFGHILADIEAELKGRPAEAREVTARLRREWEALQAGHHGGRKRAARDGVQGCAASALEAPY